MSDTNKNTDNKTKITENKSSLYTNNDTKIKETAKISLKQKLDPRYNSRTNLVESIENYGYKAANKFHRYATLGLVSFIFLNVGVLLYNYNDYWKKRRVSVYC